MKGGTERILTAIAAFGLLLGGCDSAPAPATMPASEEATGTGIRQSRDVSEFATTPEIRRELSARYARQDSLARELGDTIIASLPDLAPELKEVRDAWRVYRDKECETLASVFEGGTYGPVVELQCLIYVTDARIDLVLDQYHYLEKVSELKTRYDSDQGN